MMIVFVNGNFVDESNAKISIFDRGLMYGDGCFETLRIYDKAPAFWAEHLDRLAHSLKVLDISFSLKSVSLAQIVSELMHQNRLDKGVLRIQVTRGKGARGYSIRGAHSPSLLVSMHQLPENLTREPCWKLKTSSMKRFSEHPFCAIKSSNQLLQIMAKSEAEAANVEDVLFLTPDGIASETSTANLFWLEKGTIFTPPLDTGILAGITRKVLLDICQDLCIPCHERHIAHSALLHTKILFLTQSIWEVIEVSRLDDRTFSRSPIVARLRSEYRRRAIESPFP